MSGERERKGLLGRIRERLAGRRPAVIEEGDRLIRPSEAARRLGVSRSVVYAWYHQGRIAGVRLKTGGDPRRRPLRLSERSVMALLEGAEDG
ncbi:MAG: helix-turn-helix domain-containing protein [Deltaproteobacteria bacterium]|nr:helix-turn-helix domain-containing protein [Deltaproteobacteria bacterium]